MKIRENGHQHETENSSPGTAETHYRGTKSISTSTSGSGFKLYDSSRKIWTVDYSPNQVNPNINTKVNKQHSPNQVNQNQNNINNGEPLNTANAGGGGSHSHPFSGSLSSATADVSVTVPAANVKYANVIVATKD